MSHTPTRTQHRAPPTATDAGLWTLGLIAAALLAAAGLVWVAATANTLVAGGRLPRLGVGGALRAATRLAAAPGAPRDAFPLDRGSMTSSAVGWYAVALVPVATTLAVAVLGLIGASRRMRSSSRRRTAAARLAPVPILRHDGAGLRARLRFVRPAAGRVVLGRAGVGVVCAEPGVHVCVVAPPGQHKTTGVAIPAVLEARGVVICLSTKPDILAATRRHREQLGRARVWDPFGTESCGWSPLDTCDDWQEALVRAKALASAARGRFETAAGEFWDNVATHIIAPLLHAAALDARDAATLYRWIARQETSEAAQILARGGTASSGALHELDGISVLHDENRSNAWLSARQLLEAYRYPSVQAASLRELTPASLFDGAANTLYVVASDEQQALVAPIISAILQQLYSAAFDAGRIRPWDPPILFVLDEAANIAPLRDLPSWLSQSRAAGISWVTVWQSLAQIEARYHAEADTILNTSLAKLFASGSSDPATIRYLRALIPEASDDPNRGEGFDPRLLDGRLLCLYKDEAAFLLRPRPWFQDRRLRRLTRGGGA